jgi:glucokinase
MRAAMERNTLAIFKGARRVLLSELKEADAAVLGASALGWEAK